MSFILGLLLGCGLGALGYHYYQDRIKIREGSELVHHKNNNEMTSLFERYPYLMNLMKSNFNDPEYKQIREFFVVDQLAIMSSSVPRLRYDLSDEMTRLVNDLEDFGYIEQVEHDSLLYRIEEEFIELLRLFVPEDKLYADKAVLM
jgi:hypothetical protein